MAAGPAVMTLLKCDAIDEYPLMADWYLLRLLSTFEAATPAWLAMSSGMPVMSELRLETPELKSEESLEMSRSAFERIKEGGAVTWATPVLILLIPLAVSTVIEVSKSFISSRLQTILLDGNISQGVKGKGFILSSPGGSRSSACGDESSYKKFELHSGRV